MKPVPARIVRALGRLLLLTALVALVRVEVAAAGEPTDQIRAEIDALYRTANSSAPPATTERETAAILDRMFDWPRMAEMVLRGHWTERTRAEREEFTKLFAGLFRRAYVSRINVIDASKFQYLGDTLDGNRATVKTKVFTKKGSSIDVDYAAHLGEGARWRIDDVRVERISLMDNYRTQFDSFLAKSSFDALLAKLRTGAK